DEYWKNCVHPKPLIPPKYGHNHQTGPIQEEQIRVEGQIRQVVGHRKVGQRQAGNVRSYKDEQDSDDEEDEPVRTGESMEDSLDGADNDFNSNVSQINYEINDFNKNYCDETSPWQNESFDSIQLSRNNAQFARPNVGQNTNVKSRLDLNYKNRWNKRNRNQKHRKNNGSSFHHSVANQNQNRGQQQQARYMLQERMRSAYNSFRDNNMDQSPNVHKYNLQTIPQNSQDLGYPSTITSMIDSVTNLTDSHAYNHQSYVSYETKVQSIDVYAAGGAQIKTLSQPSNVMELNSSATDAYTVQQVARHVMLMMSTVRNIDTQ
ncbi:hypothetical protein KR032_003942, partial [Drosophila birchii]